jgi:hypothetical protein
MKTLHLQEKAYCETLNSWENMEAKKRPQKNYSPPATP